MKAGFSLCDITPSLGIYLAGYGHPERLAESIHSPIEASIMVLEENGTKAVVIGLDWCFVDWELTKAIRKGISEAASIPEQHILLCCSHTHSAPHTTSARTWGRSSVDPEGKGVAYLYEKLPLIANAVKEAAENLRECKAGFGHTHTQTGVSRRGTDENGLVREFMEAPEEIYDSNMTTVCFRDAETEEILGIFVHASAHNTAMGPTKEISSDWCGVMKKRIRRKYPVPVVFINGALGDVGPRTNKWNAPLPELYGFSAGIGDGAAAAEEVGYRAAGDALRTLEGIRDFRKDLPLKIHVEEQILPRALSMTKEEAKAVLDDFGSDPEKCGKNNADFDVAKAVYALWEGPPDEGLKFEQTIIAFGPVAIVPFPFEMFSIFSLRLRKYGPFEYTLLTSNTNGRNAYLPDRGSFAMGGYEVWCLKYTSPYIVRPDAGDIAVSNSLAALRKLC